MVWGGWKSPHIARLYARPQRRKGSPAAGVFGLGKATKTGFGDSFDFTVMLGIEKSTGADYLSQLRAAKRIAQDHVNMGDRDVLQLVVQARRTTPCPSVERQNAILGAQAGHNVFPVVRLDTQRAVATGDNKRSH